MFSIGDKVLYPMHGAGEIQGIEERHILGETRSYYILKLPFDDMNVMIPVDNSEKIGVRPIISEEEIEEVLVVLGQESNEMSSNWNKRQRENSIRLKTGDIKETAAIVRDLIRTDRIKKLSTGEKKLLKNAKQILESELSLAGKLDPQYVAKLVEDAV